MGFGVAFFFFNGIQNWICCSFICVNINTIVWFFFFLWYSSCEHIWQDRSKSYLWDARNRGDRNCLLVPLFSSPNSKIILRFVPFSGFVWLLYLIQLGCGQTTFCNESVCYVEGHSEGIQLSVTSEAGKRKYSVTFPQLSHWTLGFWSAKWEHSTREFWSILSNVHCTAFWMGMISSFVYFLLLWKFLKWYWGT